MRSENLRLLHSEHISELMQLFLTLGLIGSLFNPHIALGQAARGPELTVEASSTSEVSSTTLIAILAKKYGQDPELAKRIIWCESKNDFNAHSPTDDFGPFQLNQVHLPELAAMHLDRTKWQDNLEFGFYLMKRDGLSPWKSSEYCWRE